jgi:hypothetical protein
MATIQQYLRVHINSKEAAIQLWQYASTCSRGFSKNRLKIKVIQAPDLHSLKGSFWPQKYSFKANIRVNSLAFSFHIKQLLWSDHRPGRNCVESGLMRI